MKSRFRRARARTRHAPGKMNKTEQAYATWLAVQQLEGDIVGYRFEAYKLRLADNTHFTADFVVQLPDGTIEIHEVKACKANGTVLVEDDARVKIKVAAEQFPEFQFVIAAKLSKAMGGGWKFERLR